MKSILVIVIAFMMVFSILPAYETFADKPENPGKSKFKVSVEKAKEPRTVTLPDGRIAEKVVHIFYKEGFSHKPNHDKGGGPPDKGGKGGGDKCYTVLAKGAIWKTVEDYIVDPTNNQGMSSNFVKDAISTSLTTWNTDSPSTIFGSEVKGVVDGIDTVTTDGKNEVMFGSIDEP